MQRRIDVTRLIANHFHLHVARKLSFDAIELRFDIANDFDGIRAGLTANLQRYGGNTIEVRD